MTAVDYMIDSLAAELVLLVMEDLHVDFVTALDTVYNSDTFSKVANPRTELYYQSPLYIYSYLVHEIHNGVMN